MDFILRCIYLFIKNFNRVDNISLNHSIYPFYISVNRNENDETNKISCLMRYLFSTFAKALTVINNSRITWKIERLLTLWILRKLL